MVELLRPVKLSGSLEEIVTVGGEEFIVGVRDACFGFDNISGYVYAARQVSGWFGRKSRRTIFNVPVIVVGRNWDYDAFCKYLGLHIRKKHTKVFNAGIELEPFYGALRKIYEHYQQQYEASEKVQIAIPAR